MLQIYSSLPWIIIFQNISLQSIAAINVSTPLHSISRLFMEAKPGVPKAEMRGWTYSVGCRFGLFWVVESTTLEVKKL